ncbi:hypothetical protein N44_04563 [Microcystis aeruginosa NIES-44]|uniref:Uncharacterized protein n=1 Tax=Microcystis aeruginosa NIES-44 TaxID=449439 RepID=A0A0A1W0V1_MICAE|nr:hypothetical protein N44_04563 [Microcystis aeruginosa NIES-44]
MLKKFFLGTGCGVGRLFLFILPSPLSPLPLYNNYSQPEIRWGLSYFVLFVKKTFFLQ